MLVGVWGYLGRQGQRITHCLDEMKVPWAGYDVKKDYLPNEVFTHIVVAAPTENHGSITNYWLSRGLPVLVEKPICQTSQEAWNLVRLHPKGKLMVNHNERFHPMLSKIPTFLTGVWAHRRARPGPNLARSMIHDVELCHRIFQTDRFEVRVSRASETVLEVFLGSMTHYEHVAALQCSERSPRVMVMIGEGLITVADFDEPPGTLPASLKAFLEDRYSHEDVLHAIHALETVEKIETQNKSGVSGLSTPPLSITG